LLWLVHGEIVHKPFWHPPGMAVTGTSRRELRLCGTRGTIRLALLGARPRGRRCVRASRRRPCGECRASTAGSCPRNRSTGVRPEPHQIRRSNLKSAVMGGLVAPTGAVDGAADRAVLGAMACGYGVM
jgi:hypothetical protein